MLSSPNFHFFLWRWSFAFTFFLRPFDVYAHAHFLSMCHSRLFFSGCSFSAFGLFCRRIHTHVTSHAIHHWSAPHITPILPPSMHNESLHFSTTLSAPRNQRNASHRIPTTPPFAPSLIQPVIHSFIPLLLPLSPSARGPASTTASTPNNDESLAPSSRLSFIRGSQYTRLILTTAPPHYNLAPMLLRPS